MDVTLRSSGRRHIDVDVRRDDGLVWRLMGVYEESEMDRKKETCRMMRILKQQHQGGRPWLCLGDFNEILMTMEKAGGAARPQHYLDGFWEALQTCELGDIGFEGDIFTWRNHSKELRTYICERLDRATSNAEWCEQFLEYTVINGLPIHSDHQPIILNTEALDREW